MTSSPFACPPGRYMNSLAQAWLGRHWLILILPLAAIGVWTLFDRRALYVLAIVIFLVYPLTMTVVWLSFSLSPNSIRAIRQKTVTVTNSLIIVDYICNDDDHRPPLPTETIDTETILSVEQTSDGLVLRTGPRLDDRLQLPADAFTPDDWNNILTIFADRLPGIDP